MVERDARKMVEYLHPLERKVLPATKAGGSVEAVAERAGVSPTEAMRALQWLENKGLAVLKSEPSEKIVPGPNGKRYLSEGMPEKRFLEALDREMVFPEIKKKAGLDTDEAKVCMGILKRDHAITVMGGKVGPTGRRNEMLGKGLKEERFLKSLPREASNLSGEERTVLHSLMKRKGLVGMEKSASRRAKITVKGKDVLKEIRPGRTDMVESLTSSMLKSGGWKGKKFRRYDVEINVPRVYGGRRHFVREALEYARRIWLDMGFREMSGGMVQTSFWNFDALFTAQDHPVRDMQDTYYLDDPEKGRLPGRVLAERVRKTHENGWTTGSRGWRYRRDSGEAMKNVLRTHTTCLSAKEISSLKEEDMPAKLFSVSRSFRNETLDWSHLFELYQSEGVVIDPDANFRHLLGYLREFFRKMGYPKVRFRPAYFPYTEMSVEPEVFHPVHKQWMELGGAGIFRPEVVKPLLGSEVPVLAWGLGFDRSMMEYYNMKDIRDLYSNDLEKIRKTRMWVK